MELGDCDKDNERRNRNVIARWRQLDETFNLKWMHHFRIGYRENAQHYFPNFESNSNSSLPAFSTSVGFHLFQVLFFLYTTTVYS